MNPPAAAQDAVHAHGAMRVIEQWLQAFLQADVDAICELYAPEATFIGTTSPRLAAEPLSVRRYFEKALLGRPPVRAELLEVHCQLPAPGVAIVSGLDVVAWNADGATVTWPGRVTFVLRQEGDGWRIIHFHRSPLPGE